MTLKHAIRLASAWSQGHVCTLRDGDAEEYHKMALEAFRAQQESEKNEPLTLEELRGMVGKPVYIKSDGDKFGWVLVGKSTDAENVVFIFRDVSCCLASDWYGAFGPVAYRRPPIKEAPNG